MNYVIQFRSPRMSRVEQKAFKRSFPDMSFTFIDGVNQSFATLDLSPGDSVVLAGSGELNIATHAKDTLLDDNEMPVDIDRLIHESKQLQKKCQTKNVPLFGICFGHQLLAAANGGEVEADPDMAETGIFKLNNQVGTAVFQGHNESVVEPPENAKIVVGSSACPVQVLSYPDGTLTCQFHPELTGPDVQEKIVKSDNYHLSDNSLPLDTSIADSTKFLQTFLESGTAEAKKFIEQL